MREILKLMPHDEFFTGSVAFTFHFSFTLPPRYDLFDFKQGRYKVRLFMQQVFPRRYEIMPNMYTNVVLFVALSKEDRLVEFTRRNEEEILGRTWYKYSVIAFRAIRSFISAYRDATGNYYGNDVIEAPASVASLISGSEITILHNGTKYTTVHTVLPKENFSMHPGPFDSRIRAKIYSAMLSRKNRIFDSPLEYLAAAHVSFLNEHWNLTLIQSVIVIESSLSAFALRSKQSEEYRRRNSLTESSFANSYRNTRRLASKISSFMFPVLEVAGSHESQRRLRRLLPGLLGSRSQTGVYMLRNMVVHEGLRCNKRQAQKALHLARTWVEVLMGVADPLDGRRLPASDTRRLEEIIKLLGLPPEALTQHGVWEMKPKVDLRKVFPEPGWDTTSQRKST